MESSQRVNDVVEDIGKHHFILPSIQRQFVWEEERILKLLDSIMSDYPIGALMAWKPNLKLRRRYFCADYKTGMRIVSQIPDGRGEEAYMILDGQQRLQSLFISFQGAFDDKRVYLKIDSLLDGNENDMHYDFRFLNPAEAESMKAYVALSELAKLKIDGIESFLNERLANTESSTRAVAYKVVARFLQAFCMDAKLQFQMISESLKYDDVLEVFERVNSGGVVLSKSDLLFSTVTLKAPEMEEQFAQIVDELNRDGQFEFNTDFIIKTCFVVFDKRAKYEFVKLDDDEFLNKLRTKFALLKSATDGLRHWLEQKAWIRRDRFLKSKLALIPIIDYLMLNERKDGIRDGEESTLIRQYLYMTFFTRLFSRSPDSVLDQIHDILKQAHASRAGSFPIKEISALIEKREKRGPYQFRDIYLDDLDLVLNTTVPGGVVDLPKKRGWSLEIDHIVPKAQLSTRSITLHVDDIGNLRMWPKLPNIIKSDHLPKHDTEFFASDDPKVSKHYQKALSNLTQENFSEFVLARRATIREHVQKFLGFGITE